MIDRRNCGCRGADGRSNCESLKAKLKTVDFAIIDTALYLDAYPNCKKALEHYRALVKERAMLAEAINGKCGPMTHRDNEGSEWTWASGPWPWEADAN